MPVAWYFAPYARRSGEPTPTRYCVMDDFTTQIHADGGTWAESECLGNEAVVKVLAGAPTLAAITADARFTRIPRTLLNEPLSDLTPGQRTAIRDKFEALGYPTAEIQERMGTNLADKTLRDVLRFICTRRCKPRYDARADAIVLDGPVQACRTPESVDGEVMA